MNDKITNNDRLGIIENGITAFETGAQRESNDVMKGRMDMIPGNAIIRVSKRFQEACIPYGKYPEFNWQKGMPISRYMDSAIRHLYRYLDGEINEDHLAAACTNILMAMWTEEKLPQMQDIPARINNCTTEDNKGE